MGCIWEYYSEFGFDICLFAEFVGGDSVELFVAFDWYYFCAIGENGMIRTFSEEVKTMLLQVSNEITSFDRHGQSQWAVAQSAHCRLEFPFRFADRRAPFH
jgi:hypothetical protein